jgi:mRNA-degrading endonuclease toxin of MazEF toxin-antitoxin module
MSVDTWNAHALDIIVVPLTTRPGPSRPEVRHAGLRQTSYARCGGMGTLPKGHLKQRIGHVDEGTLDRIGFELRRLLGLG